MIIEAAQAAAEVAKEPAVFLGMTQEKLNALGLGLSAIGGVAVTVWGWITSQKKKRAEDKAVMAEARTDATIADAQGTVYRLLEGRLVTLEAEMVKVREELAKEREHSRSLEQKLWRLDSWIRAQNLVPPVFS